MQAKDIPDLDFLRAVDAVQEAQAHRPFWEGQDGRPWANWGTTNPDPVAYAEYGPFVLDHFPGVPEKVLRAKGQRLIDRGLMTGCMCGCRGEMELTEAGLAVIAEADAR